MDCSLFVDGSGHISGVGVFSGSSFLLLLPTSLAVAVPLHSS